MEFWGRWAHRALRYVSLWRLAFECNTNLLEVISKIKSALHRVVFKISKSFLYLCNVKPTLRGPDCKIKSILLMSFRCKNRYLENTF